MSSEITALHKHACPACGAQAEWDPAKQKLVCPFCGTESPYQIDRDTGKVAELDLAQALREAPAQQTLLAERRSVRCQSCRAVMVFAADRVGQNCEFCGSPALVPYEDIKAPVQPRGLLPFTVDRHRVRDDIRRWWKRKWLAPNRLGTSALVDTVKSVYIPYWTFDARAHCPWEAEAGHYYYVPVEGRDSKGRPVVRQERRVRWEPASGVIDHVFDDEFVAATRGIPLDLLRQIEPFPTQALVPYDTAFLSGHIVEYYQVDLTEGSERSLHQMHATLERLCAREIPGDTYRNLQIHPTYSDRTFKHILVPIWLLMYTFGPKAYQVIVNGATGEIAGRYPYSIWKILLLVLVALVVVGILIVFGGENGS